MPGQEVSKVDRERIDPKFFCPICNLILIEPMQTSCGHLLCRSCVERVLRDTNPVCPKDGTLLKENEIFQDRYTNRELMQLQLHCLNNECGWFGVVKDLQAHINICDYSLIKCVHTQCTNEVKRCLLAKHLEEECLYRSIPCQYCGETLPLASMEKHREETCPMSPLTCEHCGLTNIPRKEMKKHLTDECEQIEVECDFVLIGCDYGTVSKRKELRKHYKDASRFHVQLLLKFILELYGAMQNINPKFDEFATKQLVLGEVKQMKEAISAEIKSLESRFAAMSQTVTGLIRRLESLESTQPSGLTGSGNEAAEFTRLEVKFTNMEKEMGKLTAKNNRLETQLREKTEFLDRFRNKVDEIDQSVAVMTAKLSDLESMLERSQVSYNGVLLWKIENFKRKRQDAINGVKNTVYSQHFYSSQFGYKMCVKMYMNGDGFGKGSHLSLFFVVMKGEYDSLQSWPFQKKITMMLLDQGNGDHMIDAFHADSQSSSFQRPKSDMNIASGSPLFMPLDSLNSRQYIKDDTMFIKIIVD